MLGTEISTVGYVFDSLVILAGMVSYHVKEGADMKKTLRMITVLVLATGIASSVMAKSERKDQPNKRFVEDALEVLGGVHFPEKIKIKRISSIKIEDTYYHVYEGELDKTGYHIIIFDNYRHYLGYYESDFPPTNYEIKGSIVIDPNDVDEDGDPLYYEIPIDPKKGIHLRVVIGTRPSDFVKSPKYDEVTNKKTGAAEETAKKTTVDGSEIEEETVPEYRKWIIIHKGKEIPVRALYIKQEKGKVYLKAEANGVTKPFLIASLSREDQAYVKQLK